MAFVEVNPKYRDCLRRHGLVSAGQFLRLPAVVISGHPDRHVAQVSLGTGPDAVVAFLKREHRVWWKDRLAGGWAGFGLVSKSYREARTLRALQQAGLPGPEWIAAGADERGRAFLLVRELSGFLDLRLFLERRRSATPAERLRLARRLGEAIARVHAAGFDHPDLYAKHVLIDPDTGEVRFLDWQRSRRRRSVSRRRRWRDLAALHASLADHLARPGERLACLCAYLRAGGQTLDSRELRRAVRRIQRQAEALLRRRHVREQHQPPLGTGTQNLIWLDGEALSVTREFWSELGGKVPGWLLESPPGAGSVATVRVDLPKAGEGVLQRRRTFRPLGLLWDWLGPPQPRSPELRQAGLLFRLQRYGLPTPRLLAVGQRQRGAYLESFLLLEPLPDTVPLAAWLATAPTGDRRLLFRECCVLLRRLHEAHCCLAAADGRFPLVVEVRPGEAPAVVLATVEGIATRRRLGRASMRDDFAALRRAFAGAAASGGREPPVAASNRGLTPPARRLGNRL